LQDKSPNAPRTAPEGVEAGSLQAWLAWQETLHGRDIELGLERCRAVASRLGVLSPDHTVITVAGTNGKGSTVAMLERIFRAAGYQVATYTSPHLVRYNERIRLQNVPVDDARICAAFAAVEAAREGVPLTVFEYGTLAALHVFEAARPDIAILEVGMGGRLDAVNVVDPDVAVIATLDIDHVEFLGGTREQIAREKAGIMRANRPAVCSDPCAPQSLVETAHTIGAHLSLLGQSFHFADHGTHWTWWSGEEVLESLPKPGLSGAYQLRNASGVLKAVSCLANRHPVAPETIRLALATTELFGRFQRSNRADVEWILDVAHNVQAVGSFVDTLNALPAVPRTHVVLGMLTTKDRHTVMTRLAECVDCWYFATLDARHGGTAEELREIHAGLGLSGKVEVYGAVSAALEAVAGDAVPGERVLVVGSFITVGEAMSWFDIHQKASAATPVKED
jgi:dihydrofolate synthase/folylpolyglutamate synthase